jgi:ribosomal protein S8
MLENGLKAIYVNEDEVSYINDTKYTNSYVYFITDKGREPFWKKLKSSMNEEKQINKEKQIKKVTYEIIDSKRSLQMKKYKKLGYLVMT